MHRRFSPVDVIGIEYPFFTYDRTYGVTRKHTLQIPSTITDSDKDDTTLIADAMCPAVHANALVAERRELVDLRLHGYH